MILPILTLKLLAIAMSLQPSEKGGQIRNLRSNTYPTIWSKFGENRSSRSWDHFAQWFI